MSKIVTERIEHQRKQIRQTKLQGFFKQKRQLMETLPKEQAALMLIPQLQAIGHFAAYEDNWQEFMRALQFMMQIMSKYQIVMTLMKQIDCQLKSAEMKLGPNKPEISWIQLFVLLLKKFSGDLNVGQKCSYILMMCALQIREVNSHKMSLQASNLLVLQSKQLRQAYPYELLLEQKPQIVQHTLNLVHQLLLACNDGTFIYFLISKKTPNAIVLLNSLTQNQLILAIESIKQIFITTSLTVLFYVQHYNYSKFQEAQFLRLVQRIKHIVFRKMTNCQTEDQFIFCCQSLKVLSSINGFSLLQSQFEQLQEMVERQLSFSRTLFFALLKAILYNFKFTFRPACLKMLLGKLFNPEARSQEDVELKCTLIDLISYQTINSGNRFREEDAQIFMCSWGQYTQVDRLLKLVSLLDCSQRGEKYLRQFFQLLCQLMNGQSPQQLNKMVFFLQEELETLLNYPDFKELLEQNNFKVL